MLRVAGVALWCLAGAGATGAAVLLTLPLPGLRSSWRRGVMRAWGRGLVQLLGIRVRVTGTPPVPPFYLVSNHLSYVDILLYAALVPGRFVAKREVRGWPGLGLLAAVGGSIFIDRTRGRDALRVQERLAAAVGGGDGVIVFAEATSSPGSEVLPFRPALLEWAARNGYPVHYASVSYRTPAGSPPAGESVCWWGDMEFVPHLLELCRLPAIEASVRFGEEPLSGLDRRDLAERLRGAVASQFTPVAGA